MSFYTRVSTQVYLLGNIAYAYRPLNVKTTVTEIRRQCIQFLLLNYSEHIIHPPSSCINTISVNTHYKANSVMLVIIHVCTSCSDVWAARLVNQRLSDANIL